MIVPHLKEFRLTRKRTIKEECFVMAKDWEHAEQLGHEKEHDWEHVDSQDTISAEEEQ
mgnify:FL=1|tara:strand:- start:241 stop:414 length:174 start_codon:yes stop_codon:yes gene_type:complete